MDNIVLIDGIIVAIVANAHSNLSCSRLVPVESLKTDIGCKEVRW